MRWYLLIGILTFSLYAAPPKLALTSPNYGAEMALVDRIMTDQRLQDEFEVLERQNVDSLIREQTLSNQALRQNFPHAELLGFIHQNYDPLRKTRCFELHVWDNIGRKLVHELFPEESPVLVPSVIDALRKADKKRNLPNPKGFALERINKARVSFFENQKLLAFFSESYIPAAFLSHGDVVLFERNELTTLLQERQLSKKIFMFAGASRIGNSDFFLGANGNPAWEINVSDFNGTPLGRVVVPDILTLDFDTLKEKCTPVLKYLANPVPNDPVNEATRSFEQYRKTGKFSLLVAAIALDPENPVYRKFLLSGWGYFALQQYQGNAYSINRLTKILSDPGKLPDAEKKKKLLETIKELQLKQENRMKTMPELANQMISVCREIRAKNPDDPESLFGYLLLASRLLYVCGQGKLIPGDDLYRELRLFKGYGRVDFLNPGSSAFIGFFDITDAPAIREIIMKILLLEFELRKSERYRMSYVQFPHHRQMKTFYAEFPQDVIDRLRRVKETSMAYNRALFELQFLKNLCSPDFSFAELDRERKKLHGFLKENIKLYNEEYYNHVYPSRQEPTVSPPEQLGRMLMNPLTEKKAFELALKLYPGEESIKESYGLQKSFERAALSVLMEQDVFDLCNQVLRKVHSPFRYEKLADWNASMTYLQGDEFYAFFPAEREFTVMDLPSGDIRKLGKLDIEIPQFNSRSKRNPQEAISVTEHEILLALNGEFHWFDRKTLRFIRKRKFKVFGMGFPSGGRIYILSYRRMYSCSSDGNDWKTEFDRSRSPLRFPEEKENFLFYRVSVTGMPGVLRVHGNGGIYLFDFNKGKIELQEKRMPYVLWEKDNVRILEHKGKILRQTMEVKK